MSYQDQDMGGTQPSQASQASHANLSFDLPNELQLLSDEPYLIPEEVYLPDLQVSEISSALDTLIDSLSSDPESIQNQITFDLLRSFLKHFHFLNSNHRYKLIDSIISSFNLELDSTFKDSDDTRAYLNHSESLQRFAFILNWLISVAEKNSNSSTNNKDNQIATSSKKKPTTAAAKRDHWNWSDSLPSILTLMSKALRLQSSRLFPISSIRDAFISSCILRPALQLQETESYLKIPTIKLGIFKVVCQCVKAHGQAFSAQTSIIQALQYFEHLAEPMAELLGIMRLEFDYERLGEEVLREIANKTFNAQDLKSPKSFARFLIRFTEISPRSTLKQISLLMKHLDSESYPMRNSLLEVLGLLIKELTTTEDNGVEATQSREEEDEAEDGDLSRSRIGPTNTASSPEQRKKQVETFFGLLFERFLDLNSYVRSKVVSVCAKLLDLPTKFPRQRTLLTDLVIQALKDKASSVRKNAIGLLTRLILTHPYGLMHGGELDADEWTKRAQLVKAELDEIEGSLDIAGDDADADAEEGKADEQEENETGNEDSQENQDQSQDGDETNASFSSNPPIGDSSNVSTSSAYSKMKGKEKGKGKAKGRKSNTNLEAFQAAQASLTSADAEKVMKLRLTYRYYTDALAFIAQLQTALPVLYQLLVSTNKAEVLESMDFFRVAYEYKLQGSKEGISKMIHLIWTKDNTLVGEDGKELKGVRSRLIEVYRYLYFDPRSDLSPRDNVARIAKNMIERTEGATLAELTSLEALFSTMMAENLVHPDVISKLWAVYSVNRAIPRSQRRGSIIVLGMLAVSKKEIVSDRLDLLLSIGLGPIGSKDIVLMKYTCVALSRVSGSVKKVKGALSDESIRFPMNHPMFSKLRACIQMNANLSNGNGKGNGQNHNQRNSEWFSLAEHAIQTIYLLGEQPDSLCADIIKTLTVRVFGAEATPESQNPKNSRAKARSSTGSVVDHDLDQDEISNPSTPKAKNASLGTESQPGQGEDGERNEPSSSSSSPETASAFTLAQLLFVVGHVALKQIVYLELVEREYKRRKAEADKVKLTAKKNASNAANSDGNDAATSSELEQVAGNAEDEVGDVIAAVKEKELLFGDRSLLAIFAPVVVDICRSPASYPNEYLRKAAVLTLCKFMCVSSSFCESQLGLLLHILTTSNDAVIRSNVVIALGDIAICFGNLIDENSQRLYAGLGDSDLGVKKHTLMVLTHLILNGMIKVKGQLGEMAKCIEDKETKVSDLAKLFFSELSTKENAVYNNLPDIISHLSIGQHSVDESTFKNTMRHIFQYIDKEKQAENVVEKLCQRFRITTEPRQWRDIAFCLSLLPFKSERSIKRLIDGLPFYQDKLHDLEVFKRFMEIVAKARTNKVGNHSKNAKQNQDLDSSAGLGEDVAVGDEPRPKGRKGNAGGAELAEFEAILEGYRKGAEEDLKLNAKAHRVGKRVVSRRIISGTYQYASTTSETQNQKARPQKPTRGPNQKARGKAKNSKARDDDDDDDDQDSEGDQEEKDQGDDDDNDDDDGEEEEEEEEVIKPKRGAKKPPAASKAKYTSKTKSNSTAAAAAAAPKKPTRRAAAKKVVESSEEEEDSD